MAPKRKRAAAGAAGAHQSSVLESSAQDTAAGGSSPGLGPQIGSPGQVSLELAQSDRDFVVSLIVTELAHVDIVSAIHVELEFVNKTLRRLTPRKSARAVMKRGRTTISSRSTKHSRASRYEAVEAVTWCNSVVEGSLRYVQ